MKKALIVYATREGQTRKVASRIGEHLRSAGLQVQIVDARTAAHDVDLSAPDQLIIGASLHAGGIQKEMRNFIARNKRQIESMPRSFFLVLLSAATEDQQLRTQWLADARKKLDAQLEVGFDDVEMIAGALTYSKYSLPLKWLMRRIAKKAGQATDTSRDYEFTDWQQVEQYARRLAS